MPSAWAASSSVQLDPRGDNWAILQTFLDGLPEGAVVTIPDGEWRVSRCVSITKHRTTLKGESLNARLVGYGTYPGPVVGWGQFGWEVPENRPRTNYVRVLRLTIEQLRDSNPQQKCIFCNDGDYGWVQGCRFIGSYYEGIVPGFTSDVGWIVEDNDFINCGRIGLSAINAYGREFLVRRNRVSGGGQGIETGGIGGVIEDNIFEGAGGLGVNIGSQNTGVYNLTIRRNRVTGYSQAFQSTNGNGKLSRIIVEGNYFGGRVAFGGGKPTNLVQESWNVIPDTYGSAFRQNAFAVSAPSLEPLAYGADQAVYGREPLEVAGNAILFGAGAAAQAIPAFRIRGTVSAAVSFTNNVVAGLDNPASYDALGNAVTTISGNTATDSSGRPRGFLGFSDGGAASPALPRAGVSDSFTGTAGQTLDARGWSSLSMLGWDAGIILTGTGRARPSTIAVSSRFYGGDFSDGEVESVAFPATNSGYFGLWLRANNGRYGYLAFYDAVLGNCKIQRWTGASVVQLGACTMSMAQPRLCRLRMIGHEIYYDMDGVQCVAAWDPSPLPAGKAGVLLWNASVGDSVGLQADDFVVRTP